MFDLADFYSGGTPLVTKKEYYDGSIPFIRSAEINSKETKLSLSDSGLKNSSAKMVSKGDILYALYGATSGEVGISKIDGAINQAILAIKLNDLYSSLFVFNWLEKSKENIVRKYLQGGQGNLSSSIIKNLNIKIPDDISEQNKIGSLIGSIDEIIELHQRKINILLKIKRNYLEQLYPKYENLFLKLRFQDYNAEWEQREFGELVQRVSKTSENINLPTVEYEDISSGQGVLNKKVCLNENKKKGIEFREYDILFGKLRPYLNKWLIPDFKGIAVGDFWVLRPHLLESRFIFYLIQTTKFQMISNISTGTRMPRSDWNIVSATRFFTPQNNQESKKIGELIYYLDNMLTLHQQKINEIIKLKRVYLHKLFL